MSQNKLRRYIRALLYPVSGGRPRAVLLPVVSRMDDPTVPVWPEDLDLREWFPFGFERDRLSYFPLNPQHSLLNHYSMFTGASPHRLAPNDCLNPRWGLDVSGNVVVVRHARANLMRVTNIHAVEHQLVNFLVARWAISQHISTSPRILMSIMQAGLKSLDCMLAIIETSFLPRILSSPIIALFFSYPSYKPAAIRYASDCRHYPVSLSRVCLLVRIARIVDP